MLKIRGLHAVCCAVVIGLLAGCVPPAALDDEDVVGVWVSDRSDGGRVEFLPDGRLTMTGVPLDVLDPREWDDADGRDRTGVPIDATGTWENLPDGDEYGRDPRIELTYDPGSGPYVDEIVDYLLSIYTFADGDGMLLGIPLGDPDRHNFYILVREAD